MMFVRNNPNKNKRFGSGKRRFVYSRKTYANPFFRRKNISLTGRSGVLSNKIKLTIFAAIILIIIIVWLLFFSTLLKINNIEVKGAGESMTKGVGVLARQVAENRLLGKNNLLLYNKNELSRLLRDKYYLQSLNIEKKFFHTLKITLEEKQQAAVWREDDKYFYLDGQGNIISQVDTLSVDGSRLPLVENLTEIKIDGRQANINQPTLDFIMSLFNEFKDKKHGFDIEKFILDKDINTIKMATLAGPKIYFNLKQTVAEQATRLDLIIKEKLKDDFSSKEYIDLRYGNNIYIK